MPTGRYGDGSCNGDEHVLYSIERAPWQSASYHSYDDLSAADVTFLHKGLDVEPRAKVVNTQGPPVSSPRAYMYCKS
jgi:hypothetical protein